MEYFVNQAKTIQEYVKHLEDEIKADAPSFKGNLKGGIKGNYTESSDGVNVSIDGPIYASFQDLGVNGVENSYGSPYTFKKRPPISALNEWATAHGFDNVYVLAWSIYRKGIKPKGFLTNNVDETYDEFGTAYAEALWNDYLENDKNNNPEHYK